MRQQYTEYRTGTADHRPSLHLLPSDIEKFDLTTSFFSNLLEMFATRFPVIQPRHLSPSRCAFRFPTSFRQVLGEGG